MEQGRGISNCFAGKTWFALREWEEQKMGEPWRRGESLRQVHRHLHLMEDNGVVCVILERDGRSLDMLSDQSVEAIVTDHPWEDMASNKGGNRSFADFDCFRYTEADFHEKARVLKTGCFLAEVLPEENESNYEYLYQLKQMAKAAGFLYYCKVPWRKNGFVSNTGRKAKNMQDILIFSKGKARNLRPDAKRIKREGGQIYMSGARGMLPAMFDVAPVPKKKKICQGELPVTLCQEILSYLTLPGEVVLDQFSGSGAIGVAALGMGRRCILIEKDPDQAARLRGRVCGIISKSRELTEVIPPLTKGAA